MPNPKPLVFFPSPRDLPQFKEAADKIHFDKLWLKYYPELEAYQKGRDYFLQHDYTHLVIVPDDLIVTQEQIEHLVRHDLPVVSGWSNLNKVTDLSSVSFVPPPDPPIHGCLKDYHFQPITDVEQLAETFNLLPTLFSGFTPTVLEREIVERFPFRREGCCIDSFLSLDLEKAGIKQYNDLSVRTIHLRKDESAEWYSNLQTGKKTPEIIFEYGIYQIV